MTFSVRLPFWSEGQNVTVTQEPGDGSHSQYLYNSWDFELDFSHRVRAIADGIVVDIRETVPDGDSFQLSPDNSWGSGGIGNIVTLRHEQNGSTFYSSYFHLRENFIPVAIGEFVQKGDEIGQVGNTGARSDTHLHLQVGTSTLPFGATNHGWPDGTDNGEPQLIANAENSAANTDLVSFENYGTDLPSQVIGPPPDSALEPDLIVKNVSVQDSSVALGDNLVVTYDVENIGDADAPAHFTRFVYSEDTQLDTGDVSTLDSMVAIAAGQTVRMTSSIPTSVVSQTDSYNLIVVADHSDSVAESDENNNAAPPVQVTITGGTGGPGPADLIVTGVSLDDTTIVEGGQTTIRYSVGNQGNTDAASSVTGIYISTDSTFDNGDALIDSDSVVVDSGEVDPESEALEGLASYAPGTYWLFAVADINNDIFEDVNEGNNASTGVQLTISDPPPDAPDLIARNLVLGATTWEAGASISANWEVVNNGPGNATNSQSSVFLSTDSNVTTDDIRIIVDTSTGPMPAGDVNPEGGGSNGSDPYVVPDTLAAGTYFTAVIADDLNNVTESNEGNNLSNVVTVTVAEPTPPALPDLKQSSVSWNDSELTPGQTPSVEFKILNDADTASGAFSARLYLSTDGVVGSDDLLVADYRFASLGAHEESAKILGANPVPAGFPAGDYYYLLTVDPANEVNEVDETNNTFYSGTGFWNPIVIHPAANSGVTRVGTSGNDILLGTEWDDTLYGRDGDDTLIGGVARTG